jgi:hypothetical protein
MISFGNICSEVGEQYMMEVYIREWGILDTVHIYIAAGA